ncbi:hypothetical protein ABT294_13910 [Nonomuraea sp. NPDC000554]|uniref:hypothetical protein n=1 Tax=Nonomuraea sp. NPDC000554 TaxID=3154259 RepID=UPI00332E717F
MTGNSARDDAVGRLAWAAALDVCYLAATLALFAWALSNARPRGKLSRFGD